MMTFACADRARRWGVASLVALCAFVAPSAASSQSDPIFPPVFVHTTIEPASPCTDSTVHLNVHLADPCLRVVSFSPSASPPLLLVRRLTRQGDSCATVPNLDRRYSLGRFPAGEHVYTVRVRTEVPNDSGYAVSWQDRPLAFVVRPNCASGGALPHGLQFEMGTALLGGPIPAIACPDVPSKVRFSGVLASSCERYTGYRFIPSVNQTNRDLLLVDMALRCPDSLTMCLAEVRYFRDSVDVPSQGPGPRLFDVLVVHHLSCADSLPRTVAAASFPYTVADSCPGAPPPPPAGLPHGVEIAIGRPAACDSCPPVTCPNAPVLVKLRAFTENSCVRYTGMRVLPLAGMPDRDVLEVGFRTVCPDSLQPCLMYAALVADSTWLPGQAPGAHRLEVRVVDSACADSVLGVASRLLTYTALDSCGGPPPPPPSPTCTHPYLFPRGVIATDLPDITVSPCDLRVGPGGTGSIELNTWTGTPLAGLQGVMLPPKGPLHLDRIEAVGAASGMHLQTQRREDGGIAWAIWADHGAPIATNQLVPVLRVFVRADSVTERRIEVSMGSSVTAASDSLGRSVGLCVDPFYDPYQVWACVGTAMAPVSCDANGDGQTNVADLVRMVRCWFRPAECPDTLLSRPDCNHDGAFHLDDVLCCARTILGGRRDSTAHAPAHLRFAFGEARMVGGVLQVPLTMSGGGDLGGALLRLEYPADRYESGEWMTAGGVPAGGGEIGTTSWTVVTEHGTSDLLLGLLRLDDAAADEVTTVLQFRLRAGQSHGGAVSIAESELTAPDGAALTLDLGGVQAPLNPNTAATPPARLALSAARPNPSAGRTTFAVALPAPGDVDLAIYDLAGRRVITLWRGTLAAGEREFAWDGTRAKSGVYFARLVVNGEVRSTRVVLRRDR